MITNPDQLDYNEELYDTLGPRDKEVLYRFFNIHSEKLEHRNITKGAFTQDELRKILASKLQEETQIFLDRHEELADEGVRVDPAVDYIAEHYDVSNESLDVDNRYELLLLLYEENLLDQLEELLIRATIRSYSARRTYILEDELDFQGLTDKIASFHQMWNKRLY